MSVKGRPRYGADRPDLTLLALVGVAFWFAFSGWILFYSPLPQAAKLASFAASLLIGFASLFVAVAFLVSTLVTKFRQRDALLGSINWEEVKDVLDVGCGPGLLLIGAAKRAPEAKAVGVDIWQRRVESGNRPETVLRNAEIEGVAARVEVKDGDVRNLPFPDSTFDVVVSRAVLHNLKGSEERKKAIEEIVRVLRPRGQIGLILVDSWHLREYLDLLRRGGVQVQKVVKPPRYMVPGLAFLAMLVGTKS